MGDLCPCCGQPMSEPKPEPKKPALQIRDVIRAAAAEAGVSVDMLMSFKRKGGLWTYRQAAYAAARKCTGRSYPALGRYFKRNHATIIRGARCADPKIVQRIAERVGA